MNLSVSIDQLVIIGEYQGAVSCGLQIMTNRLQNLPSTCGLQLHCPVVKLQVRFLSIVPEILQWQGTQPSANTSIP